MTSPAAILLGIGGGTGSGKTTLAGALRGALGAELCCAVDHDAYYRDLSHLPPAQRARVNYDHPDSLDHELFADHLAALRVGRAIAKPRYDFATHTRVGADLLAARPVVLVEGILVLCDERVRRSFDLTVFVDAPADVRFIRRLKRDVEERGRTTASVVQQYLDTVRPMHERFVAPCRALADVVVDGLGALPDAVRAVEARVRQRLAAPPGQRGA